MVSVEESMLIMEGGKVRHIILTVRQTLTAENNGSSAHLTKRHNFREI